ncbi:hypothetical protein [Nocardioides sp.]|uniref:hypothetical protein n=1 Tax=Nocardioides sp. TaxID=35761 RepID=UPI00262111C3|nr:hypothetical protein [Nocardioides sp.]
MADLQTRDVFIELGGQDDNLGDSVLRAAYLNAARGRGHRIHLFLGQPTSDYVSGLALAPEDRVYPSRAGWVAASDAATRPVHFLNAGEINPPQGVFPAEAVGEVALRAAARGGTVIAAGIGIRHPEPGAIDFHRSFVEAAVVSWRDAVSQSAAGFGDVAPDWAFGLGTPSAQWAPDADRPLLALTLRFDRAWPGDAWLDDVRRLAHQTGTRIVTVAQVARDAPRAVRLAEALGGEYLVAASTRHDDLDQHVREVYGRSLAVVSDRAHGLIIAATEGAVPVGSAADPEKLSRMLAVVGLESSVGTYDQLGQMGEAIPVQRSRLAGALDEARIRIGDLDRRIHAAIDG